VTEPTGAAAAAPAEPAAAPSSPSPSAPEPAVAAETGGAALERERWLRDQLERAQQRAAAPAERGVVLHPSESGLTRFWRWLIDDLRSERRAASATPEAGMLAPLLRGFAAALPRPPRRRRRRRRRR
jgi:hypothetical protein